MKRTDEGNPICHANLRNSNFGQKAVLMLLMLSIKAPPFLTSQFWKCVYYFWGVTHIIELNFLKLNNTPYS